MARKKKRKFRLKKIWLFLIPIILFLTIFLLNYNNIKNTYLSNTTGYNKETIEAFVENNLINTIKEHKYSKTLETILNTEYYNNTYINNYLEINYVEKNDFHKNINILLEKGYSSNDINNIYNKLNNESIDILIKNNYIKDITNIINTEYFKENKLERYIKYYETAELDTETILLYVNIGLDNEYYTNVIDIENQDNIQVIVNKYYRLQKNYIPNDLENVSYGYGQLKKEAKIAFDEMCAAAKKENITIYGGSGYRSYNHQLNLYNNYVNRDGKKAADTYSARAGHSEHQTGLAMDIMNAKWGYIAKNDKEYTWLINNSYKYGFILRYLEGKEEITGYMYEPWHYRYVGIELATEITNLGITYEEYIAKK